MRKKTSEATAPFFPLCGRGPIFFYSRKERYDTTTASKASNPNLSCQYSFLLLFLSLTLDHLFSSTFIISILLLLCLSTDTPTRVDPIQIIYNFFLLFLRSIGQVVFEWCLLSLLPEFLVRGLDGHRERERESRSLGLSCPLTGMKRGR